MPKVEELQRKYDNGFSEEGLEAGFKLEQIPALIVLDSMSIIINLKKVILGS